MRQGLNQVLNRLEVEGVAWGDSSVFHLILGVPAAARGDGDLRDPGLPAMQLKKGTPANVDQAFHLAMLHEGVHVFHGGGLLSIGHDDAVLEDTLAAFERALVTLQENNIL